MSYQLNRKSEKYQQFSDERPDCQVCLGVEKTPLGEAQKDDGGQFSKIS